MKKYPIVIIFAIVLLISIFFLASPKSQVKINGISINVELAKTPIEHEKGLMYRESLEGGMLFIYDNEDYRSFWMKNTLIPLDIIFINSDNEIIDIVTMQPCEKDPCEVYTSKNTVKNVLEVNKDFAKENNITIGDIVRF